VGARVDVSEGTGKKGDGDEDGEERTAARGNRKGDGDNAAVASGGGRLVAFLPVTQAGDRHDVERSPVSHGVCPSWWQHVVRDDRRARAHAML
jgi:hypothetical protein